jgi:hyperosmotically inducible protein
MRTRSFPAVLVLIVCAAPLSLLGQQSDAELTRSVNDALRRCPHYTIFDDVTVSVAAGEVTLSGEMTSSTKRGALAAEIGRLTGVRRVITAIDVLPSSAGDVDLRQRAAHAIYSHAAFWQYASMPSPPIHIIVRNGHVRLTGTVASEVERALAQNAVAAAGAASVKNELKLNRTPLH